MNVICQPRRSTTTGENSQRRGTSLVELIAAMSLLAVVGAVLVPLLGQLALVRQDLSQQELAIRELRNLAEQARVSPQPAGLLLAPSVQERLQQPELGIRTVLEPDGRLERVTLSLSWVNQSGQRTSPLELSAFRPPAEGTP